MTSYLKEFDSWFRVCGLKGFKAFLGILVEVPQRA